ncbi:MAG TPA: hypothetical protein VND68_05495 [Chloroflexia bacterium]|jgi:hypothetical protein|nr:hypothetical protein [Chloroflexia bacterium]
MLAHLLRQFTGGIVTFFLAAFVLYTAILYAPTASPDIVRPTPRPDFDRYIASARNTFELDKPWPLNFLAYMFDPNETTDVIGSVTYPKGVRVSVLGMEISGSGVVTGDLGRSITIARNMPVIDIIGPGLYLAFASVISLLLTFTYVAAVQRAGRPALYSPHPPPHRVAYVSRLAIEPAGAAFLGRRF